MSEGVLRLSLIVARLAAECPSLREVGDAAAFSRLTQAKVNRNTAFVLPLAERGGPNRYACEAGQEITATFGVIIFARDMRTDRGSAALSELEIVRGEVVEALRGWTPAGADSICTFVSGQVNSDLGRDGLMAWQQTWSVMLDLRETA